MTSASAGSSTTKNPRRVAAGRRNGGKRRPWSDADRRRLSEQGRRQQPWRWSTGPRSPEGKRRASANARAGRREGSIRAFKDELADVRDLVFNLAALRQSLSASAGSER